MDSGTASHEVAGGLPEAAPGRATYSRTRHTALTACALVAGIANVSSVILLSRGIGWFRAGAKNIDPPLLFTAFDVGLLTAWAASCVVLAAAVWFGNGPVRRIVLGCVVVCASALPTGCITHVPFEQRYEDGFCLWANERVPWDILREWNAALPAASTPAAIPAAQWPPELVRLAPANVTQLPKGQGVVMEWGRLATWGTSRRVVVCSSPTIAPPRDEHHFWRQIAFGVYAAFQDRG